jgi:hypothetical protein
LVGSAGFVASAGLSAGAGAVCGAGAGAGAGFFSQPTRAVKARSEASSKEYFFMFIFLKRYEIRGLNGIGTGKSPAAHILLKLLNIFHYFY